MARVYVGNLPSGIAERDLLDEFSRFGKLKGDIWVARKPAGFAFVEFEDVRDAEDAVRKLDGFKGWRVEISNRPRGGPNARATGGGGGGGYGGGPSYGGPDRYGGGGGRSPSRYRSSSPAYDRYRRSPSPRRRGSPPPRRGSPGPMRGRDVSPVGRRGSPPRSPGGRRASPPPRRVRSPSPARSPVRNGSPPRGRARERDRSPF